jgi:hypothetical protein
MKQPVKRSRCVVVLLAVLFPAVLAGACSHEIGDQCTTSVDCDPNGTRSCDLSQPNGYCTIAGCDQSSCPSSSACIRTFPTEFLSTPCDPTCVGSGDCAMGCQADEVCVEKWDAVSEPVTYVCSKQSYEQRACAKTCSSNADCRGGYDCRETGLLGSMLLTTDPKATTSFCAPHVPVASAP